MTAGQEPAARQRLLSRWTTRRWLRVGVSVALSLLAVLSGLGIWAMDRAASVTTDLVNTRSPALTNSIRLEAALVNQETGIRGYGLTGQKEFLEPYQQGLADEKAAVDRLNQLLVGNPRAQADQRTVLSRAGAWQQRIATPISSVPAGAPAPLASDRAAEGRITFDRLRQAMTTQQDHLVDARSNAVDDLARAERLRNWVFTAIALVIVLLAVAVFEGLRRGITDPLSRLGTAAREVARGRFDHPIDVV
ncbi:CHASE3 domain-containing protein, partial [Streptomyces sp. NRRL F-5122]|uniref:CHASE3 domain-containing protein n=5 Tax=unclassified Streptomyces TaxID=2593676 RepID=UPI000AABD1FB